MRANKRRPDLINERSQINDDKKPMIDWNLLFMAFGLMLVIEGVTPLVGPDRFRRMAAIVNGLTDNQLRGMGFALMLGGVIVLTLAK